MNHFKPKTGLGALMVMIFSFLAVSCEDELIPEGFSFSFNPKEVTIPATGGTAEVAFIAPIAWEASTDAAWIQFSPAKGDPGQITLRISVSENPAREARNSSVTVSLPEAGYTESFKVTQSAHNPSITLSQETLTATSAGISQTVKVKATVNWTATSDVDWISFQPASGGFGETVVTVTVASNPKAAERNGAISFSGESQNASLAVSQEAADQTLNLSEASVNAPASGGEYSMEVSSTLDWTADTAEDWISVTPASGAFGQSSVVIKVQENAIAKARTGAVHFRAGKREIDIPVNQKAAEAWVKLSVSDMTVSPDAGEFSFKLTSNADWAAAGDSQWFSFGPASGFGDADITGKFELNPVTIARSGVITFTAGSATVSFTLSQEAAVPVLTVAPETVDQVPADGGTYSLVLTTTEAEWTLGNDADWIAVSPVTGTYGQQVVTVTVAANELALARESVLAFRAGNLSVDVPVRQLAAAAWIRISGTEAEFSSASGSLNLTVQTNAQWSVSTDAQWVTLSADAGNPGESKVNVAVAANDTPDARSAEVVFTAVNESIVFNLSQKGREETGGLTGDIGDWEDGGEGDYGRK